MVQFNWKGTWLPNLPYNENVVVEYQNVNYISTIFVPPTDVPPYYDPTHWDEMLVIFNTPTPTPSVTETPIATPTPTLTETPTNTPTPTPTPMAVTGYNYTLVVLPYNPPSSGNTIFPQFSVTGATIGITNPNTFAINGVYWNSVDNTSVDRTSYYNGMLGVSVMAYFTQNGNTVIYSGTPTAFTFNPGGNPGFSYNPNIQPNQLVLIQSASTDFVTGQTVNISYTTI
jgi:hypothetical protein